MVRVRDVGALKERVVENEGEGGQLTTHYIQTNHICNESQNEPGIGCYSLSEKDDRQEIREKIEWKE